MAKETHAEHELHQMHKSVMSIPAAILLGALMISLSILLGTGVLRLKGVNPTGVAVGTLPVASGAPTAALPQPTDDAGPVKVSMNDAPMLGDPAAPVTMIEFSDYECPFCKSYFDSTYPQIKANYIDTGKLKLVFRNLPLSFHQNAHKEAEAALCAREQGGDGPYFKFHDMMFTKTTSNGLGLALDSLPDLANQVGLNGSTLKSCLDSGKYTTLVDNDIAYAAGVGATGTPTFFVGKSDSSGTITAMRMVGAQPYSAFKALIDQQLAQ